MHMSFGNTLSSTFAAESDYSGRDRIRSLPGPNDELVMENVGYTDSDDSPVTYRQMKMRALSHCLAERPFVRSQAGNQFIPNFENPSLLSWLFPHLDPWGIGGFFKRNRPRVLTLEEQLTYLLRLDDSPFE